LIQQHQAAIRFEHDVEAANHAYQTQGDLKERDGGRGIGGLRIADCGLRTRLRLALARQVTGCDWGLGIADWITEGEGDAGEN